MKKLFWLCGLSTLATIILTTIVIQHGSTAVDDRILRSVHHFSSSFNDHFFENATKLGDPAVAAGTSLAVIIYLAIKRRWPQAIFFTVAIGGAAALNIILKDLVARHRPSLWHHLVIETNYSFPSGHAMGTAALVVALLYLLWSRPWRLPALFLGAIYLLVIGVSRLYLGVHFPSDVLGGWMAGLAWVTACAIGFTYWLHRRRPDISEPSA